MNDQFVFIKNKQTKQNKTKQKNKTKKYPPRFIYF